MKKLIICLTFVLLSTFYAVSADNVAETLQKVMTKFNITVTDDTNVLRFYKNHYFIKDEYKPLLASAIREGLLLPENGVLLPESDDLTSVKNGLISYGLKNPNYKIISGKYFSPKVGVALVGKDTLCIDELVEGEVYTILVDKLNNAVAVWSPTKIKQPAIYRAKMYITADNLMIVYDLQRSAFDLWVKERIDIFTELDLSGTNLKDNSDDDINGRYLDKTIYLLTDTYGGKIVPLYIEGIE